MHVRILHVGVVGKKYFVKCLTLPFVFGLVTAFLLTAGIPSAAWAKKRNLVENAEQASLEGSTTVKKKRKKKRKAAATEAAEHQDSAKDTKNTKTKHVSKKISAVTDAELATVYTHIASGKSTAALTQIESLLVKAPNHKLLHLLRADVLVILSQGTRAAALNGSQGVLSKLNGAQQEQMHILQQEAWLRLNSHANRAKASVSNLVPKQLLKLADNEPYALVVDSKLSRLYVYQNVPNAAPKLVNDFYVTQGAQGALKLKEGDARTPIGAYFIDRPIEQKLPDFYGYGALNIDYPNTWDKRLGRTGHGIWLHGTPSDTYARAPYASNGCVVLANPDVEAIFKLPRAGAMPIIIIDKLDWVDTNSLDATRKQLNLALAQWLKTDKAASSATSSIANLAAVEYPGEAGMVLTRFDVLSGSSKSTTKKELYWKKEAGQWKVVLDNTL
jgi:L,D-transpeptidase catalytic domain